MIAVLLAFVFIFTNGFFVAAEFALVKMSTTQVSAKGKAKQSVWVRTVVGNLERYLSVTQFGITLASLGLGWIGEPAFERYIAAFFHFAFGAELPRVVEVLATVLAFSALTLLHVLLGELVPKLIAIQRYEQVAASSALPLQAILMAFRPLLWVLEASTKVILRAMGLSADAASEGRMSEEEIIGILAANTARSPGGEAKGELIERVYRFTQRTARQVMVPRVDVFSLPVESNGRAAADALRTHEYSRVVLTRGRSLDEVVGYLYAKDFFLTADAESLVDLVGLRRDILFVTESQTLLDVLRDMQRTNTLVAVVVDEYGGSSGILTMEDVLEEIVGDIRDEADDESPGLVKHATDQNTWDVDARLAAEELQQIGAVVPEAMRAEPLTGLVARLLGRVPKRGDRVLLAPGVTLEVMRVTKRRVVTLRVRFAPPPPTSASDVEAVE